jgi:hypothetical protein
MLTGGTEYQEKRKWGNEKFKVTAPFKSTFKKRLNLSLNYFWA